MKIKRDFITNSSTTNFLIIAKNSKAIDSIERAVKICHDGYGETDFNFRIESEQQLDEVILSFINSEYDESYPDIESLIFDQRYGYDVYKRHKSAIKTGHKILNVDISYHNETVKDMLKNLKSTGDIIGWETTD